MPEITERAETIVKGKTAGVPNLILIGGGALGMWWLLGRKGSSSTKRVTSTATTQPIGPAVFMPPGLQPSASLGTNPLPAPDACFPDCGPAPAPSAPGGTPTQVGSPLVPQPAPSLVVAPPMEIYVPWSVSPIGVTAGAPLFADIMAASGPVTQVEVWAQGGNVPGSPNVLGWHKWGSGPPSGFRTQIPTEDYAGNDYVIVAIQAIDTSGFVAKTGNPYLNGFDPRMQQTISLWR